MLTNQESGEAFDAIAYHIARSLPRRAGVRLDCRVPEGRRAAASFDGRQRSERRVAARNTASRPSLPLAKYAGTYRDAWYGDITIAAEGDKLVMRFSHTPSLVGDLEHWQHDTFVVRWRDRELRADAFVTFALNPDGSIDQAKMQPVSPTTDFSFDFQDLLLRRH